MVALRDSKQPSLARAYGVLLLPWQSLQGYVQQHVRLLRLYKALGCDVNVAFGAVYRLALNCFATPTAKVLWFWMVDFRKR